MTPMKWCLPDTTGAEILFLMHICTHRDCSHTHRACPVSSQGSQHWEREVDTGSPARELRVIHLACVFSCERIRQRLVVCLPVLEGIAQDVAFFLFLWNTGRDANLDKQGPLQSKKNWETVELALCQCRGPSVAIALSKQGCPWQIVS